jgi:hypothetical protein
MGSISNVATKAATTVGFIIVLELLVIRRGLPTGKVAVVLEKVRMD